MSRANLEGVTTLFEDMLREDPEYNTLRKVPDLLSPLADFHTKWQSATDEFVQQSWTSTRRRRTSAWSGTPW